MGLLQCERIHCHIARSQTIFDLNKFALQIHLCQKYRMQWTWTLDGLINHFLLIVIDSTQN